MLAVGAAFGVEVSSPGLLVLNKLGCPPPPKRLDVASLLAGVCDTVERLNMLGAGALVVFCVAPVEDPILPKGLLFCS